MSTSKTKHFHLDPNPDLPEEIIVKILCRLPVKPLIRFSSVSKRWHSLILSDPHLGQSHFKFKLASEHKTLPQRLLISTKHLLQSLEPEKRSFGDNSSLKAHTFPQISNQPRHCDLLGSCNGLVFVDLYDYQYHNLFLWNPSTRFVRKLPNPGFVAKTKKDEFVVFRNTGLGYVLASDDYKIFVAGRSSDSSPEFSMEVFSSRANVWKCVEVSEPRPLAWHIGDAALTNEALHWAAYCRFGVEASISAFDLSKEEFRTVPFPVLNGRIDFSLFGVQVASGGCLCVSFSRKGRGLEFWVMREYGVLESWAMLLKINIADLPEWFNWNLKTAEPVFVTESGTVVLHFRGNTDALIRIQRHKKKKLVFSNTYIFNEWGVCDVIQYVETLLSVPIADSPDLALVLN